LGPSLPWPTYAFYFEVEFILSKVEFLNLEKKLWLLIRISNRFKSGFNKKLESGLKFGFQISNPDLIEISDF
jgi:hypothetical protein